MWLSFSQFILIKFADFNQFEKQISINAWNPNKFRWFNSNQNSFIENEF